VCSSDLYALLFYMLVKLSAVCWVTELISNLLTYSTGRNVRDTINRSRQIARRCAMEAAEWHSRQFELATMPFIPGLPFLGTRDSDHFNSGI